MAKKILIRLAGATLSTAFFLTNAAAPYAQEQSFWESRRGAAAQFARGGEEKAPPAGRALLSLPPAAKVPLAAAPVSRFDWLSQAAAAYGTVRETYISPKPGAPLVVHIQDAHGIEEAQRNIASLIQTLTAKGPMGVVAVEGAEGPFTLETFRQAGPAITKDIADAFLAKGLIAGPEYAGLTSDGTIAFQGAEDKTLYDKNVTALKEAYGRRGAVAPVLAALQTETDRLVAQHFSPALKNLDGLHKAYEAGNGLGKYIEGLAVVAAPSSDMADLRAFREALALEGRLDFKKVEAERRALVEKLVAKLSKADLEALVAKSIDHRAGRLTFTEYHRHMGRLCAQIGAPVAPQSSLGRYIEYLAAAEKVDAGGLFTDMSALEKAAWKKLAVTPAQMRLVEARADLALLDKLIHHQMTALDWKAYDAGRARALDLPKTLAAAGGAELAGFPAGALKPFEEFWTVALRRNDAIVKNTLARVNAQKGAVLVAGGFHTAGLTELLKRNQVSYVVLAPRFVVPKGESDYLDLIATDAPPLERLLAADRLTLVQTPPLSDPKSEPSQLFHGIKNTRVTGQNTALPGGAQAAPCDDIHKDDAHVAGVDIFRGPGKKQRGAISPDFLRAIGRVITAPFRALAARPPKPAPAPVAPPRPLTDFWTPQPMIPARHDVRTRIDGHRVAEIEALRAKILAGPNYLLTRAYSGYSAGGPVSGASSSATNWLILPIESREAFMAAMERGDINDPVFQGSVGNQLRRYLASPTGELWVTTLHDLVRENPVTEATVDTLGDAKVDFSELDMRLNGVHSVRFSLAPGVTIDLQRSIHQAERVEKIPADVDFFDWRISERITELLANELESGRGLHDGYVVITPAADGRSLERVAFTRDVDFRYSDKEHAMVSTDRDGRRVVSSVDQMPRSFWMEVEVDPAAGEWTAGSVQVYDTRLSKHLTKRSGPLPEPPSLQLHKFFEALGRKYESRRLFDGVFEQPEVLAVFPAADIDGADYVGATPTLIDDAHRTTPANFAWRFAEGQFPDRVFYKANGSSLGHGNIALSREGQMIVMRISHETDPKWAHRESPTTLRWLQNHYGKPSEAGEGYEVLAEKGVIEIRVPRDEFTGVFLPVWRIYAGGGERDLTNDPGMVEAFAQDALRPDGFAYETRLIVGAQVGGAAVDWQKAAQELDNMRIPGSFARHGKSAEFAGLGGREDDIKYPAMFDPLLGKDASARDRAAFEAHVEKQLTAMWAKLSPRLRASGAPDGMSVSMEIDLLWRAPRRGEGRFPMPILLESKIYPRFPDVRVAESTADQKAFANSLPRAAAPAERGDRTLVMGWFNRGLVTGLMWFGQMLNPRAARPSARDRTWEQAGAIVGSKPYAQFAAPITEAWGLPGLALALMPFDPTGFVALPLASLIFTMLHGTDAPVGRQFQFFAARFVGALAVNLAAVHLGPFLLATEFLDSPFWNSLGASFLIGAIGHSLYNLLAPSLRLPALTIGNGAPASSLSPAGLVEELEVLTSSPKEIDWERVESLATALEAAVPEPAIIEHLNRLSPSGESLKNFNASHPNPLVHRIVAFHERVELTIMKDRSRAGGNYTDAFPDAHGRALKLEALLTAVVARRQGVELDWRDFYYARPADNTEVMRDVSPSTQGLRELNTLQLNDDATYTPQAPDIERAISFFAKNGFTEGDRETELYPLLIRSKLAMRETLADLKGTKLERLLGETHLTFLLLRVFAIFRNHPARFAGLPYADLTKSVLGVMSGIERSIEGGPNSWPLLYHREGDVVAVPMGDELIKLGRNMDGHENRLLERFVLAEAVAAPATKTVENLLEDLRGAWESGDEKGAQLAVKSLIDADSPAVLGALSRAMRNGNTTEIEDPAEFVFATGIRRLINDELPRQPSSALKRLFVRSALTKPGEEFFPDDQLDGLFSSERFHEFAERFAQGIGNQAQRGYPVSLVADVPNKDLFFEEVNGRMHPRPEFSARLRDGLGRQKTRLLDDIQYDLRYRSEFLGQISEGLMNNFQNQLLDAYIDALDKFKDEPRAAAAIARILEKAWSRDFPAKEEKAAQVLAALSKVYEHPDASTSRKALNALLFAVLPSAGDRLDPTLEWLGRMLLDWEITMVADRANYESAKIQLNKIQDEAEGWERKEIVAKQREVAEIGMGLTRRGEEILGLAKGLGSLMAEGAPIANQVRDHVLRLISNKRTGPHVLGELLPLVSPALTSTVVAETVLQAAGWGDNPVLREALADGAKDPTRILDDNTLDLRARILVLAHHSQNEALLKSIIDNPAASPALRLYAFSRWGENFLFEGSSEEDFTLKPAAAGVMSGFAEKLRESAAEVITDAQTNPARIQSLFSNPVLADEELKILLLAEFLDARDVMQAETPAVMAEALRLVAQAHRDDFSSSAHSGLRFGGLLFSHAEQPADLFFGVAAHEWFHVVLDKEHGFSSETRAGGILHEFGADVIAYARVKARGRDTKDFLRETNSIWSLGEEDSLDVHSVARKQLMSLLLNSVAKQESINAAGLSDAVITTLREEGVETRTTRDLFWRILMRHLYPGSGIPPTQSGEGEVFGVIDLILLEHPAQAGKAGPAKGKAFGLGQHAAALAIALALGVAAYVAPGQIPLAEELSRILQAVGLALSTVWSFAIGLPAALNVAARALSPREPTLDFKTALWVDKWAQKNGAGMDWQNSPANGWTAETLRGPRGEVTVRIAPWLTARSESAIYNQLRGLLLRMVLTHEEWRIQGVSTTAIFLNKPFSLFRTLQTPRLPQALQPQDYTVPAWQAKVATVDGRWNIRFFSDQNDKPLFIDRFSDLTPTALAQLISVYNNVKVSADDIAGEINVVFHAKGSRRQVYLVDVRLKDGRAFPLALVVADQDPRKVYFDEFVDGPTYRQLAHGGRLTAAQRAAAVRELLQKARELNGGLPMDFNLNNLIYNHRRAEAVLVDIDSAPLYILDRRNDANPAAPIPAHPNNHYLFLGLLYAQFGRLDVPGDNRVLLATIEETLGTTGRKILENAFAKAQAMDAVATRTNFLRRREAMFREMGTSQRAFDALHARMLADLEAYLSDKSASTNDRPTAGAAAPWTFGLAARRFLFALATMAAVQFPSLAHSQAPAAPPAGAAVTLADPAGEALRTLVADKRLPADLAAKAVASPEIDESAAAWARTIGIPDDESAKFTHVLIEVRRWAPETAPLAVARPGEKTVLVTFTPTALGGAVDFNHGRHAAYSLAYQAAAARAANASQARAAGLEAKGAAARTLNLDLPAAVPFVLQFMGKVHRLTDAETVRILARPGAYGHVSHFAGRLANHVLIHVKGGITQANWANVAPLAIAERRVEGKGYFYFTVNIHGQKRIIRVAASDGTPTVVDNIPAPADERGPIRIGDNGLLARGPIRAAFGRRGGLRDAKPRRENGLALAQGAVLEATILGLTDALNKSLLQGAARPVTENLNPNRVPDLGQYWPGQPKTMMDLLKDAAETPMDDAKPGDTAATRNRFTTAGELMATGLNLAPAQAKTWLEAMSAGWAAEAQERAGQRMAGQSNGTLQVSLAGLAEGEDGASDVAAFRRVITGFLIQARENAGEPAVVVMAENQAQVDALDISDPRVYILLPSGPSGANIAVLPGLVKDGKIDAGEAANWISQRKLPAAAYLLAADETKVSNTAGLLVVAIKKLTEDIGRQVDVMLAVMTQA